LDESTPLIRNAVSAPLDAIAVMTNDRCTLAYAFRVAPAMTPA
jgi:hypothetical protein